jgi:Endonuclease I/Secretion system C-terminal sorting domain/Abnormal spindle-like microcephaly-assoc'd, ASPM-SPD-2-Hydin
MMKNYLLLFLCFFSFKILFAQNLIISPSQLNFGSVTKDSPESLELTFTNPLDYDVEVVGIELFTIYGKRAFSVTDSIFLLNAGESTSINVTFNPRHNIYHNTELIVHTNNNRGSISIDLLGQGIYAESYYNSTLNLKEEELKLELKDIISENYHSLGYDDARDTIYMRVDNWKFNGQGSSENKILKVYTGDFAVGYANRSDLQSNYEVNAEHTFPQSTFDEDEPMRSDMHHLFATSEESNGVRSNYPFGYAVNFVYWEEGGSVAGFDEEQFVVFEPRDEQKGPSARAMLYFLTRYENHSDYVNENDNNILKNWNFNFEPTTIEENRNDDIQYYQQNRNPFTDHPEFADRIRLFNNTSTEIDDYALAFFSDTIDFGNIASTGDFQFSFLIYNKGNRVVDLTNFQFSASDQLTFLDGSAGNQILSPGESKRIIINLNIPDLEQSTMNESLTFSTNQGSIFNYQIPIYANYNSVNLTESAINEKFILYPNPAENYIIFKCNNDTRENIFFIYNAIGKLVCSGNFKNNLVENKIDISSLSQGIYYLQIPSQSKTGSVFVK